MQRFPFQSWLNYNPLLPASDKWSTPLNSPHHDDFKKVWFVGCLTTARAPPASQEGVIGRVVFSMFFRQACQVTCRNFELDKNLS